MRKIALVGATGIVGAKLTEILNSKNTEAAYDFYSGQNGVGAKIEFRNRIYGVKDASDIFYDLPDYAVFTAINEVSAKYIPLLAEKGVICIDNSSVFRMDEDVPLVIRAINKQTIGKKKVIANPNCTTIQLALALSALAPLKIKQVTAVTYQAASGAGREGAEDLKYQRNYGKLKAFSHPLFDNVIPHIGAFTEDGYTEEEMKVIKETRKILNMQGLSINCFAVRVPVSVGHSIFANIQFENDFSLAEVRKLLKNAENILLFDDNENNIYPMPITLRGTPFVGVGRLSKDLSKENSLNCFIVADNLVRGAAYNAYELLETAIENNF